MKAAEWCDEMSLMFTLFISLLPAESNPILQFSPAIYYFDDVQSTKALIDVKRMTCMMLLNYAYERMSFHCFDNNR